MVNSEWAQMGYRKSGYGREVLEIADANSRRSQRREELKVKEKEAQKVKNATPRKKGEKNSPDAAATPSVMDFPNPKIPDKEFMY